MVRYDGLEYGRKIREFSSKQEAENWKARNPKVSRVGSTRGNRVYTIRKSR
jgi:hypothetical protein